MENIKWHKGDVNRTNRSKLLGFDNKVIWFTGLSGSGKSTIAHALEKRLFGKGMLSYVLDGDNVRHGLNKDLSFSSDDREENIRRVSEVAKLFYDSGVFVLVSFISPYVKDRRFARELIGSDFIEVFVDCPLEECEKRDVKGLYKKARNNEIKDFTGVNAPYEKPKKAEITLDTSKLTVEESVNKIMERIGGNEN